MVVLFLRIAAVCILFLGNAVFCGINTEGQQGFTRTLSCKTNGEATINFDLGVNYAQDNKFIHSIQIDSVYIENAKAKAFSGIVSLALGPSSFIDVAASVPLFYDNVNPHGVRTDAGLGDFALSIKIVPPSSDTNRSFFQGYFLGGTVPTGTKSAGIFPRHPYYKTETPISESFYSTDCFTFKPMLLWTFEFGKTVKRVPLQLHFNLGGIFMSKKNMNNMVLLNGALEYKPVETVSLFVDVSGMSSWQNLESKPKLGTDPLMLSPGIKITSPTGLYFLLSGDFGIYSDRSQHTWSLTHEPVEGWKYKTNKSLRYGYQLALGWNGNIVSQDPDKDGLSGKHDRCPNEAEDIDGFKDSDGCPDHDNDNDGMADTLDKCPSHPEDIDGFEDGDGCPDYDNDKDGFADSLDTCPDAPEDRDGYADQDGCPDLDNDQDGISDSLDRCPNMREDVDGVEDMDGCPDYDNDKDAIADTVDKCPNEPETYNEFEDEDGCPDQKPEVKEIKQSNLPNQMVLEGVAFTKSTAKLLPSSYPFLDAIVKEMQEFPDVEIEIRGHTDSIGKYERNMLISQQRAEAIRLYLIKKGVEGKRIRAVGFGSSTPIADNRTAAGREKNRRTELIRLK